MSEGTDRLFVAVDLPDELKGELSELRTLYPDLARELRWGRTEGIHITLRFLGESTPEQKQALMRALSQLPPRQEFTLRCEGLGTFGSAARPRVLWAGVRDQERRLERVQAQVEALCIQLGWPAEERRFSPHVTLARPRGRGAFPASESLEALLARYANHRFPDIPVREVTLYSSKLGRGGSIYTTLLRV